MESKKREITTIKKAWVEFKVDGVKKNYLCSLEVVGYIERLEEENKRLTKGYNAYEGAIKYHKSEKTKLKERIEELEKQLKQ